MKRLCLVLLFLLLLGGTDETAAYRPPEEGPPNPEIVVLDSETFALHFLQFVYLLKIEDQRLVLQDFQEIHDSRGKLLRENNVSVFRRIPIESE